MGYTRIEVLVAQHLQLQSSSSAAIMPLVAIITNVLRIHVVIIISGCGAFAVGSSRKSSRSADLDLATGGKFMTCMHGCRAAHEGSTSNVD